MIIECVNCAKKFTVDSELISNEGRTIQCGSCNHVWFFKKDNDAIKKNLNLSSKENKINKFIKKPQEIKKKINPKSKKEKIEYNVKKGSEMIKYQNKPKLTFINLLSYTLVSIISFTAIIIFLDTFKSPLYSHFPDLEFLLFNLYETIEDIKLFISDLV